MAAGGILKKTGFVFMAWVMAAHLFWCCTAMGVDPDSVTRLLGKRDACLLTDPDGRVLISFNVDKKLIPASTLKILTALAAYHYLGEKYRFTTDIFLSASGNLTLKGYGDPLLISEVLTQMADATLPFLPNRSRHIQDIVLDNSYFSDPLTIPGVSDSFEPYDAPNGALCANFNTVSFTRVKNKTYTSGEPQTPLLPSVLPRIRASGLKEGRIVLSNHGDEAIRYLGELFGYFLSQRGVKMTRRMRIGVLDPSRDRRILTFTSPYSLDETISKLMAYSNNFMANQLLIAAGAKAYGPPGTLAKGVRAAREYARKSLGITPLQIVEGSGISRKNRVSPRTMNRFLKAFAPHCELLLQTEREYYKTGTLNGISTRAGFLKGANGRRYPFVVMINSGDRSMDRVMNALFKLAGMGR